MSMSHKQHNRLNSFLLAVNQSRTQNEIMEVRTVYLEIGRQADNGDNMILKDITDHVLVCLNLLRGVRHDSSNHYMETCHKEADMLYNKIIDFETGHSVDEAIIQNQ